jgi:hypothetical protein
MTRRRIGRTVSGGVVVGVSLIAGLIVVAAGEPAAPVSAPPPPPGKPAVNSARSYIGGCAGCHRDQAGIWSETKHAKAFTDLPMMYRNDPRCLTCHVTGYGESGGYAAGTSVETLRELLDVGCESCHGPGSAHVKAAKAFAESSSRADEQRLEKQVRDTIYRIRPENPCLRCHVTPQGHKPHPAYQGQPPRPDFRYHAPSTGYGDSGCTPCGVMRPIPSGSLPPAERYTGIKTCAACHYQQYQQWRTERHSMSLVDLPTKYKADRECLKCHMTAYGARGGYATGTSPQVLAGLLNVSCEACHGIGGRHVQYTSQFINCPRLSPELEQTARGIIHNGLAGAACVRCHVRQSHKEHPKYDKPADDRHTAHP